MSIVHPLDLRGSAIFGSAQAGCAECGDRLVRQHEGLGHAVLRRQACGDAAYADLLQGGCRGLGQAILHFDPGRGVAFST
jgi:DNA-directed RNA polymerase specialized sigma subunit